MRLRAVKMHGHLAANIKLVAGLCPYIRARGVDGAVQVVDQVPIGCPGCLVRFHGVDVAQVEYAYCIVACPGPVMPPQRTSLSSLLHVQEWRHRMVKALSCCNHWTVSCKQNGNNETWKRHGDIVSFLFSTHLTSWRSSFLPVVWTCSVKVKSAVPLALVLTGGMTAEPRSVARYFAVFCMPQHFILTCMTH